jgi:hypothetical protein
MLALIVAAVGVVIALLGFAVMLAPGAMGDVVRWSQRPGVLYGAITVRIIAGAFFVFASEACAWPMAIGTVGVLMLAAGFVGLFIGLPRVVAMTAWFLRLPDVALRSLALLAVLFGAFIVYAAV